MAEQRNDDVIELNLPKPEAPEKAWIVPDLVVYRQTWEAPSGTPDVVATRLRELKEHREEIERMWREEGRTRAYIPLTEQARKMRVQAQLYNRLETKHAVVTKRFVDGVQKSIELDPDLLEIAQPLEELRIE